jgi:hypothetical protein
MRPIGGPSSQVPEAVLVAFHFYGAVAAGAHA